MSTRESRPTGVAPESATKTTGLSLPPSTLAPRDGLSWADLPDRIHIAWLAGHDHGYAQGQQAASEALARGLLHSQACEMAGLAQRGAMERHGPAWADAIKAASEVE